MLPIQEKYSILSISFREYGIFASGDRGLREWIRKPGSFRPPVVRAELREVFVIVKMRYFRVLERKDDYYRRRVEDQEKGLLSSLYSAVFR